MVAGRFYALLRFEEASLALRAVMQMSLVDQMGTRGLSRHELREMLGFTEQAARTFFALLQVMEILECRDDQYRVTTLAAQCLAGSNSRLPFLAIVKHTFDRAAEIPLETVKELALPRRKFHEKSHFVRDVNGAVLVPLDMFLRRDQPHDSGPVRFDTNATRFAESFRELH